MFLGITRKIAFEYYKKIVELKPEWEKNIELIVTPNNQHDTNEMLELVGSKEHRKRKAEEFKKEDSDFKIAIVVDMWLTGFDVPCLDVIYLDKPIKMHNLMQTIARTNRVYNKDGMNKEYGLVVDYIGLWNQLKKALAFYSDKEENTVENTRSIKKLKESHLIEVNEIIKQFELEEIFNKNEYWSNRDNWVIALKESTNLISKNRLKPEFTKATKNIHKWIKEVLVLLDDHELFKFHLLKLIRSNIINIELGNIDFGKLESNLVEQINKSIAFDETTVVKEIEGNSILLSTIIEIIEKEKEDALEFLQTDIKVAALRKMIDLTKAINYQRASEFSEKLNQMLDKYNSGHVTAEELKQLMQEIFEEAKKMNSDEKNEFGFTEHELAYYGILASPVKSTYDENKIADITRELLEIINKNEENIKSWSFNEQSKMNVRKELKILLSKHGYPPEDWDTSSNKIVDQIMFFEGQKR